MREEGGHIFRYQAPHVVQEIQQILPLYQLPLPTNTRSATLGDRGKEDERRG